MKYYTIHTVVLLSAVLYFIIDIVFILYSLIAT